MYTLHMSWSVRALVLTVAFACGLAPQVACFMPGQPLTQSEMDCCQGMSGDCSRANISYACCRTIVRTDVGVAAKVVRNLTPPIAAAEGGSGLSAALLHDGFRELSIHNSHAPPPEPVVSSILRI